MQELAELLRSNDYYMEPVLKTLFKSSCFMDDTIIGADIKSPMDFVFGMLRQLKAKKINWQRIARLLALLGQLPFNPPNVAGWEEHRTWLNASSFAQRQGLVSKILEMEHPSGLDLSGFLADYPRVEDPKRLVSDIVDDLLPVSVSHEVGDALLKILLDGRDLEAWDANKPWATYGLKNVLKAIMQTAEYQLN